MKLGRVNKIIIILFILAVFIVPLSIHLIFVPAEKACIQSEWTAGELLVYCGAIIGATATIVAIIMTINFTMENQKESGKLAVKPYMQSVYKPIYGSLTDADRVENITYVTYGMPPTSSHILPAAIGNAFSSSSTLAARTTQALNFIRENHLILYEITNIGANNAVNINFKINNQPIIPPFAIPTNTKKSFLIRLKAELLVDNTLELTFKLEFSDIAVASKTLCKHKMSDNFN